jgi:NADH dehydrogenase
MSEGRAPLFPDPTSDDQTPVAATAEETDPLLESLTSPRRVLVTGGAGFVGRHLVPRLLGRGHHVRVLSRNPAGASPLFGPNVDMRQGDVTDAASLDRVVDECDVVVHLVPPVVMASGKRQSGSYALGTENVLHAAEAAGVNRFVYVSALGAGPGSDGYLRTKFYAEGEVLQAGLEHVVFRPSIIYGPGDHFTTAFVRLLRGSPVVPMPGRNTLVSEPISIEDVADALSQAVERADLADRSYELVGPQRLPLPRILRVLARRLGVGCQIFNLPRWAHQPALRFLQSKAGLDEGTVAMLRAGALSQDGAAPLRSVFRIEPMPFRHVIADYL